MLFVKVNGEEFGILFKHEREDHLIKTKKGEEKVQAHPVSTECAIFKDKDHCIGNGIAKVYHTDRFKYDDGRKHALTKALVATGMSKEERAQVWAQYRAR
jgi:ferredoxin